MRARVEELRSADQVAVAVADLEVDVCVAVRLGVRHDLIDPDRPSGEPNERVASDAVPHRGGGVVARRAEVAVAVDQRVAQRPRLGHPDQGVVDRRVAVRVVVTHDVTDDAGALDVAAVGPEAGVEHGVEDLAVHRLEAVPHVRQRPADDDAHRVVEVRALHLDLEADRLDPAAATQRQRTWLRCVTVRRLGVERLVAVVRLFRLGHVQPLSVSRGIAAYRFRGQAAVCVVPEWAVDKPVDMWITAGQSRVDDTRSD